MNTLQRVLYGVMGAGLITGAVGLGCSIKNDGLDAALIGAWGWGMLGGGAIVSTLYNPKSDRDRKRKTFTNYGYSNPKSNIRYKRRNR